jgi:iron complex outermembrane receptor protein
LSGRAAANFRMNKRAKFLPLRGHLTKLIFAAVCISVSMLSPASVHAQQADDLTAKSIEDLMNIQITSVSRKEEELSRTAAAVFVITQADIKNSGATNIPDLLRMVPGIYVAQINANTWAITARSFNARFSNELLVLLDGRSVYSPATGGVFWDVLDIPLEDVQRIEVIRGPGGSIWGANAVNGVVDIISRNASDTRGAMVSAGSGSLDPGFGTVQYGGAIGDSTDYRLFAKYFDFNRSPNLPGENAADDWHLLRGGFRIDRKLSPADTLTAEGDMYTGEEGVNTGFGPSIFAPGVSDAYSVPLAGGFFQADWKHSPSSRWDTSLQFSYDTYERDDTLREARQTFDLQFQHHFLIGNRQDLIWGLEDRYSISATDGNFFVSLAPPNIDSNLFSAFVQDEIALLPDRLYLTLGTKIEHNYYTGVNAMPTARIAWTPSRRQTLWAAFSRAPRTPADLDIAVRVNFLTVPNPAGLPTVFSIFGNRNFQDENLNAYELGYRREISTRLSVDAALYYSDYSNQQTDEPLPPFVDSTPLPAHLVVPVTYRNLMHGEAHGIELAAHWKATDRWTLSPGYAFERIHMHLSPLSQDSDSVADAEGSTPVHSAQLRSQFTLTHALSWNTSAYFSARLADPVEPSYTRLDTGLSWQFAERSSFAVFGQNLLRDHHTEFADSSSSVQTMLLKRSVYAQLTVKF